MVQRGDDAEIDVHGLEGGHRLIADVQAQSADGGGLGEVGRHLAQQAAGRLHAHQEAAGAGLHVPLHAGHLAGKGDAGVGFQAVVAVQQAGGIQIGVAVHDAVAQELGVPEGGNHGEHPALLRPFQMGLEAHQIVDGAVGVVLAELHHGVGVPARLGVGQALGLQGAEAEGVLAPAGHDLHRHAALEHAAVVKAVDLRLLGGGEGLPKGGVLFLIHGAVDIVGGAPVVPGGEIGAGHIHAVEGHQRGGGVVEMEAVGLAGEGGDLFRQGVGGQGAGGDDHLSRRNLRHLPLLHGDVGVGADGLGDHPGKAVAVHRQGAAGGDPGGVGAAENEAA